MKKFENFIRMPKKVLLLNKTARNDFDFNTDQKSHDRKRKQIEVFKEQEKRSGNEEQAAEGQTLES